MATLKNKSLKKSLVAQAEDNTSVVRGNAKNPTVLKEGIPNDHSRKHLNDSQQVGVSVGTTLNMGDYESLRVDVWLSDSVQDNETVEQAYERVVKVVDNTLQNIVKQYK